LVVLAVLALRRAVFQESQPRSVFDAVDPLLPGSEITSADEGVGEITVQVSGEDEPVKVHIHRVRSMTVAWVNNCDESRSNARTFALKEFRHNLKPGSLMSSELIESQISRSLSGVLVDKQYLPDKVEEADLWVSVYGAIDGEISLDLLEEVFNRPGEQEWAEAVHSALTKMVGENATTIARGSLILDVGDARTTRVLWHATAMADILVDVSEEESDRRIKLAISEMLREFPCASPDVINNASQITNQPAPATTDDCVDSR
jgi:hypothetical protein